MEVPPKTFKLFRGLPISQRLPLLIFILLFSIIVAFSYIAYIGVRKAALDTGQQRLQLLTQQLSSMLGQNAQQFAASGIAAASQPTFKNFIISGGLKDKDAVLDSLRKIQLDKMSVYTALLDSSRRTILYTSTHAIEKRINFDSLHILFSKQYSLNAAGNLLLLNDSMYYAVVTPVKSNDRVVGYLARWRIQYSTAKVISQFTQLLGTDAALYIGNADGSLWTNLITPVKAPPVFINGTTGQLPSYTNNQNKQVIASVQKIPNTQWQVLVEFPSGVLVAQANRFLRWISIAGIILLLVALVITRFMSRNITRPLKKLTTATSGIAQGDYSQPVETERNDELGELARSFTIMSAKVIVSQQVLEKKVEERTAQLEAANKELGAFSYSVSHDLRAPLRAIDGYAAMLEEDYANQLDDEAKRMTQNIKNSASKMGQLIDDLIAFSQMGSKEISTKTVDMHKMAERTMQELLLLEPDGKFQVHLQPLPAGRGDENLLQQVWQNLISNALKYSSKTAHPVIEIGAKETNGTQTYYIRDNGAGFDMQYKDKLFGVFQRLHHAKDFTGNGIGLAFVKRIIDKHHGAIYAEAEPGKGATFYFSLPI